MVRNKNIKKKLPDQCAGNILPYKLFEYALKKFGIIRYRIKSEMDRENKR